MGRGDHTGKRFVIPQECQAYNSTGQGCHALVDDEEDTVDRRVPVWFQGHRPIYCRKRRGYTVEHQARATQQLQTPPQRALSWQVLRLVVEKGPPVQAICHAYPDHKVHTRPHHEKGNIEVQALMLQERIAGHGLRTSPDIQIVHAEQERYDEHC